jgi:predicted dehydrogenase/threonine dehydrogenase-like Zn-dependent dehydrogenase
MKQLSQNLRTGELSVSEVPEPQVSPGQVLVQTAFSLISAGTERSLVEIGKKSLLGKALSRPDRVRQVMLSVRQSGLQATLQKVRARLEGRSPLGYSSAGIVRAVGEGVTDLRAGDRVACAGSSAAHAEVVCVPVNLCAAVPENVPLDQAAFTTLGAIALQGVRQADVRLGEVVAVLGLGLLGALTVQLLRAAGCTVVGFDPNLSRCQLALELGAQAAANTESELRARLSLESANKGADAVILTAGTSSNRPIELAGELSRDRGRVVVVGAVGLRVPRAPYYEKELELRLSRSYGPGRYDPAYEDKGRDYPYGYVRWTEKRNMQAFLRLASEGKVRLAPLITHRFSLEQALEAYDLIRGKTAQPSLGVLFAYPAAVAEAKPPQLPPSSARQPQAVRLGVGVIGVGTFAQGMLLPPLQKDGRVALLAAAARSPLHARDAADRFGFTAAVGSVDEILSDQTIQAVIISTRHDSHADLVVRALQAGKAVHVEKPLALNSQQLAEVQAAYQAESAAFVNVGFNRRFAPLVQPLLQLFADRTEPLSMLYRVNAGYLPLEHWAQDPEQGGGRIVGEVCHFLDLFQALSGALITRVSARALPDLGKYRADNLAALVELADGSLGTLLYTANGDRALPKEYLEVSCAGKSAALHDFRRLELYSGAKQRVIRAAGQDKGHAAEMRAWVGAVLAGAPEPVPFSHALAATRATFALLASLSSGEGVPVAHS